MGMCVVDWAAAGSWAQAAAGFAGVGALIWATKTGAAKFGDWQKQKQTERQMVAADRLLALVYRLETSLPGIRSPASFGYEVNAAEAKLREDIPDFDNQEPGLRGRLRTGQIVLSRIADRSEDWNGVHTAMPEARAFFGAEMKVVLDSLWQALAHIRVSALSYPDVNNIDARQRLEADFWEGWAAAAEIEDRVGALVSGAVADAERILLPVLTSHLGRRD